jgi:hypothetical protein
MYGISHRTRFSASMTTRYWTLKTWPSRNLRTARPDSPGKEAAALPKVTPSSATIPPMVNPATPHGSPGP